MEPTATRKGVGQEGEGTLQPPATKFVEFTDTKRGLEMIKQDGVAVDGKLVHRSMWDAVVARMTRANDGDQSGEMA